MPCVVLVKNTSVHSNIEITVMSCDFPNKRFLQGPVAPAECMVDKKSGCKVGPYPYAQGSKPKVHQRRNLY